MRALPCFSDIQKCCTCGIAEICSKTREGNDAPNLTGITSARVFAPDWSREFFNSMNETLNLAREFVINSFRIGIQPDEVSHDMKEFFPTLAVEGVSILSFASDGATKRIAIIECGNHDPLLMTS